MREAEFTTEGTDNELEIYILLVSATFKLILALLL